MDPIRRDFSKRGQHKRALLHQRMRYYYTTIIGHDRAHGQDIKVQRARPPTLSTYSPEGYLDAPEHFEQRRRLPNFGFNFHYGIVEIWLNAPLGPGRRPPDPRDRSKFKPFHPERRDSAAK